MKKKERSPSETFERRWSTRVDDIRAILDQQLDHLYVRAFDCVPAGKEESGQEVWLEVRSSLR